MVLAGRGRGGGSVHGATDAEHAVRMAENELHQLAGHLRVSPTHGRQRGSSAKAVPRPVEIFGAPGK